MCENIKSNPFAGLFSTTNDAVSLSPLSENLSNDNANRLEENVAEPMDVDSSSVTDDYDDKDPTNFLLRQAFGITNSKPNERCKKQLVYVDSTAPEHAVFERIMLRNLESKLVPPSGTKNVTCDNHTLQREIIPYLFDSFCLLLNFRNEGMEEEVKHLKEIVFRNVATALQEPELFRGHEIYAQFISLFEEGSYSDELSLFTAGLIRAMVISGDEADEADEDLVMASLGPVLDSIHVQVANCNLLTFRQYWFEILRNFSSHEALGKLVIRHSLPKNNTGKAYSDTLLGALLSLSCLPKTIDAPFDFFDKPTEATKAMMEGNIWTATEALTESLHTIFHSLLKCSPHVRHLTLDWIGKCLDANASRGKLWNAQSEMGMGGAMESVSDGFMLNLSTILVRLCQPFCARLNELKILKVDPTYCAAEAKDEDERGKKGLHMRGMSSETCMIPVPEGETRDHAESFGFVTECFFLTHRALDLGYRVVLEKLFKTNQDLTRIQRLYRERNSEQASSSVINFIIQRMDTEMTKYMSLRASLLVPKMLNILAKFHAATGFWLMQVMLDLDEEENPSDRRKIGYAPRKFVDVSMPLPDTVPKTLRCIPEFVVENTVGFLCFLRRVWPNTFEEQGSNFLNPILTEVIALMESPRRMYNPHLRARLAEGLEALLPFSDQAVPESGNTIGTLQREMLFVVHPHRNQIVANLLEVFVSIEMTGQSVQFEQKFNYRRPMYVVMGYLWKLPEHRKNFRKLAAAAERNMEAVQPPLFLRFINLLMNDAVFLLDEALSNMAQLKQMLQARERGDWDKLPQQEIDQQTNYLQHIGMIARFDNILGRETINMLKMLTSEIKSIFCHPTIADRIASMLNYLLLQLVGPNKRNLKVKDQKEYDFNPANLVLNISEIYINLSHNENFTLAVSQDGRSYSSELFTQAENVLVRIGGVGILGDLDNFAKRVEEAANVKKEEEEILNNAPDEFLDPIMSTLMTDPVILPSSKITVDRQTIARHLLSDQTDPFNRSHLSMDQVQSNTELRNQIEEWIRQKKQEKLAKQ